MKHANITPEHETSKSLRVCTVRTPNLFAQLIGFCLALALSAACVVAFPPHHAYADAPTYTMAVVGEDVPSSVAPGDSFTVALTLENNQSSEYTMYAMSATIRYDTNMLEVTSMDMNNNIDVFTRDAGNGWTDAVLNFKASSLSGVTWSNDMPLMYITFNALEQGTSSVLIQRVNISNSTGMGRYACTCTDAVITVSESSSDAVLPVTPSDSESEGTTEGVDTPEADPSTLNGKDTSDTMTDEEKAEYEKTRGAAGTTSGSSDSKSGSSNNTSSGSTSSGSGTSSDSTALGSGSSAPATGIQLPVTLCVLIGVLVVAVIALVIGVVVHKRRSQNANGEQQLEQTTLHAPRQLSNEARNSEQAHEAGQNEANNEAHNETYNEAQHTVGKHAR